MIVVCFAMLYDSAVDVCTLSWRLKGYATLIGEETCLAESKHLRDSQSLQRTRKMRPSYEKQIVSEELLPEV